MIEMIEKFFHGLKIITKLIILIIFIGLLALFWKSGTGFFSEETARNLNQRHKDDTSNYVYYDDVKDNLEDLDGDTFISFLPH
ncbi:hypothetical protein AALA54_10385 [Oscillospiraceae bacterium 44-34]